MDGNPKPFLTPHAGPPADAARCSLKRFVSFVPFAPFVSFVSFVLILLASAVGCGSGPGSDDTVRRPAALSVAAASDLRYALNDLVEAFKKDHPDIGVAVSYGSSGNFFAQLANGAPFDIFLSADVSYPRELAARGLALPDSQFTYAEGRLALWVPAASRLQIETLGLNALVDPGVTRVAIANPEHAPYGRAAEAALTSAAILEAVRPKLVFGENVAQALQFVQSGSAEAGIVALSLAGAPPAALAGRYWIVPSDMHPPLEQGGVIMRGASRPDAARAFRAFLLGEPGRALLARYGFQLPKI
jgi:molybdate transport system substrate-binding protein